jgi:Domain of unknown function (DUF4340)
MKSFRSPLILMFVAAALAGGVYFVEFGRQSGKSPTSSVPTVSAIFAFGEQEVRALTVKTLAATVVLEKTGSSWTIKSPQPSGPANEAIVSFLLNLFKSSRDRELKIPASRLGEFGLDRPLSTIEIRLENQQIHTLVLGKLNFDRTGLYAIVDPSVDPKADATVVMVPTSFESAVSRPVAEWRSKPIVPKPSPKPSTKPAQKTEVTPEAEQAE